MTSQFTLWMPFYYHSYISIDTVYNTINKSKYINICISHMLSDSHLAESIQPRSEVLEVMFSVELTARGRSSLARLGHRT